MKIALVLCLSALPAFPAVLAPFSVWCSVLAPERPKSSKTDLPSSLVFSISGLCLLPCSFLFPAVRFGLNPVKRNSPRPFLGMRCSILCLVLRFRGCPFSRIQASQRPKRTARKRNEHGNKHRPEIEKTKELGQNGAPNREWSDAFQEMGMGDVRFAGFKHLSGQNGPPERNEQQTQARDRENQRAGEVRFGGFGPLSGQSGAPNREWSNAFQEMGMGEVRFTGFRHLSGQNGPPERETSPATNTGQR